MTKTSRGFTLIELLVVIAIIGILSAVVLTSLDGARKRGRDARRLSDVKQIQLALELYYDQWHEYPATIGTAASSVLVSNGYIASLPVDPSNNAVYAYSPYAASTPAAANSVCSGYHLGASLESGPAHPQLGTDADLAATPAGLIRCTDAGATADFPGVDTGGANNGKCLPAHFGTACYDVRS
jgi:prepilin-type N-terminal cleavage/methylation domain-containing protein